MTPYEQALGYSGKKKNSLLAGRGENWESQAWGGTATPHNIRKPLGLFYYCWNGQALFFLYHLLVYKNEHIVTYEERDWFVE